MRCWYLSFIGLMCSVAAMAQTAVTGVVCDKATKQGVAYATVALQRDKAVTAAVAADAKGHFSLAAAAGDYTLEVTAVGYAPYSRRITLADKPMQLDTIYIREGVAVEAVTLAVQKPIVTVDAEKVAYSVEDDPESQSATLEEVIRKVPQLTIDAEGNVQMNGQSNFKILVNGRSSSAMSSNFKEVIRSMPASTIKKIEVITNPSMKYDAEGTGGVLNIITTKSRFEGYNGSVTASATNYTNRNWRSSNSANVTLQKGKFSMAAALYYTQLWGLNDSMGGGDMTLQSMVPGTGYDTSLHTSDYGADMLSLYGNLNASYQIDSLNLITAELSGYGGGNKIEQRDAFDYLLSGESVERYNNLTGSRTTWRGVAAALSYERKLRGEGHTLVISDNFSYDPSTEAYDERLDYLVGTPSLNNRTFNGRESNIDNVFQADYTNPISKQHSIEAGLKHTFSQSRLSEGSSFDGIAAPDGSTLLQRNIAAVYAGYTYSMKMLWLRLGGRLEGAWYNTTEQLGSTTERYASRLINAVPYLSLTYMPKMGHTLSLAYSERLARPSINSMSPYVHEVLNTRTYGNPHLSTGVSHTVTLKYAFMSNKWSLAIGATALLSNNQVASYTFLDDEGFINSTYQNYGRTRFYSGDASLTYRPSPKFSLSASIKAGWGHLWLPNAGIDTRGWGITQSLNMNIALWKGARLTLSEHLMRPEPRLGMLFDGVIVNYSARLGQMLCKERLELSLLVNHPHAATYAFRLTNVTPTYIQEAIHRQHARQIRLSITYRFGKQGIAVRTTKRKQHDLSDSVGEKNNSSTGGVM